MRQALPAVTSAARELISNVTGTRRCGREVDPFIPSDWSIRHHCTLAVPLRLRGASALDVDQFVVAEIHGKTEVGEGLDQRVLVWGPASEPTAGAHIGGLLHGCGIVVLAVSFLITADSLATMFRVGATFQFVCGYLVSVSIRIVDTYKLWPATEISPWEWRPVRTLRGTVMDYTFVLLVLISFFSVVFWLAG
jgi:hypothetical protein